VRAIGYPNPVPCGLVVKNASKILVKFVHGEVPEAYYPLWATSEPSVYPTRVPSTREKRTSFDSAKDQQATFNISDASPDSAAG
jgi:hypothetical protein